MPHRQHFAEAGRWIRRATPRVQMSLIVMREDDAAARTLQRRCSDQRLKAIEKSIAANHAVALAWAIHAMMGATSNIDAVAMQTVCGKLEAEAKAASVQAK